MKTNHLSTAVKSIDKEISKLRAEQGNAEQEILSLQVGIDVIQKRIEGLQETKKSLGVTENVGQLNF